MSTDSPNVSVGGISDRLSGVKYSKLQQVAKNVGIKANQKQSRLVNALAAFFEDKSKDNEAFERELQALGDHSEEEGYQSQDPDAELVRSSRRTSTVSTRKKRRRSVVATPVGDADESEVRRSPRISALILSPIEDSAERRKKAVMAEVRQRIQEKVETGEIPDPSEETPCEEQPDNSAIPVSASKDWAKIHGKEFNKMDSIDDYLAKKQQKQEELKKAMENAKVAAAKSREVLHKAYASRTPTTLKDPKQTRPKVMAPGSSVKPFVPTIMTPGKLNFNFAGLSTNMKSTPLAKGPQTPAVFKFGNQQNSVKKARKTPGANGPGGTFDVLPTVSISQPTPSQPHSTKIPSAKRPPLKPLATSTGKLKEPTVVPPKKTVVAATKVDLLKQKLRTPPVLRSKGKMAAVAPPKPLVSMKSSAPPVISKKPTSRFGFDLEKSLKRKLPYKPYSGPVKPLSQAARLEVFKNPPAASGAKVVDRRNFMRNKVALNRADKRRKTVMQRRGLE